jgi:hypothetical protein
MDLIVGTRCFASDIGHAPRAPTTQGAQKLRREAPVGAATTNLQRNPASSGTDGLFSKPSTLGPSAVQSLKSRGERHSFETGSTGRRSNRRPSFEDFLPDRFIWGRRERRVPGCNPSAKGAASDGGLMDGRSALRSGAPRVPLGTQSGDFFVAGSAPPETESRPFLWAIEIPAGPPTPTKPRFTLNGSTRPAKIFDADERFIILLPPIRKRG